ncbi:Fe-S cluster assembly protein SufD, partial [Candidatus Pelagibacter sp.]|nr:Fe-S cluster assembly protein SufD [Candidatus Pelagibacter sp.]
MTEQIKTDFDKIVKNSNFTEDEIVLKQQSLNKFIENGFPNRKLENWKFSDLSQIINKNIG